MKKKYFTFENLEKIKSNEDIKVFRFINLVVVFEAFQIVYYFKNSYENDSNGLKFDWPNSYLKISGFLVLKPSPLFFQLSSTTLRYFVTIPIDI